MSEAAMIREARAGDQPALERMMLGLNLVEDAISGDRTTDAVSAANHMAYLQKCVAEQGGCVLVAEAGGQVVGFLIAFIEEDDGHYLKPEARRHGYISDLYVDKALRGQGVAGFLIAAAEERLKSEGISAVQIGVLAANRGALKLYEKQGYETRSIFLEKKL